MDIKKRNIFAITWYRIFSRMYFYLPILFPFFYLAGQSVLKIEILLAAYGMAIMLLLGLAKKITIRLGHKNALLIGEALKIIGLFGLLLYAKNFSVLLALQVIMGFGYAMIAGNDTVILQQSFTDRTSPECQSIQAKTNSYMFLSLLFSGLLGAMIFKSSSSLVLILSIVAALFSFMSILLMKYQQQYLSSSRNNNDILIDNFAKTYYFVIRGLVLAVFVGILPYFLFILLKVSMLWYAVVISSFTLSGFFSSKYLTKYLKNYEFKWLFSISTGVVLASVALLLYQNVYLSFVTSLILGLVSGCIRPVTIAKIKKGFSVEQTLHRAEFNFGIFNSLLLLGAGFFLQYLTFDAYIISLIVLTTIYSLYYLFFINQPQGTTYENIHQ